MIYNRDNTQFERAKIVIFSIGWYYESDKKRKTSTICGGLQRMGAILFSLSDLQEEENDACQFDEPSSPEGSVIAEMLDERTATDDAQPYA